MASSRLQRRRLPPRRRPAQRKRLDTLRSRNCSYLVTAACAGHGAQCARSGACAERARRQTRGTARAQASCASRAASADTATLANELLT